MRLGIVVCVTILLELKKNGRMLDGMQRTKALNKFNHKNRDDLDMLGEIYWHVSVFSLPLGNLESNPPFIKLPLGSHSHFLSYGF